MKPARLGQAERVILIHCRDSVCATGLRVSELIERIRATYYRLGKDYRNANGVSKAVSRALRRLFAMGFLDLVFAYHGQNVGSRSLIERTAAALEHDGSLKRLHEDITRELSGGHLSKTLARTVVEQDALDLHSFRAAKIKELEQLSSSGVPAKGTRIQMITLTNKGYLLAAEIKLEETTLAGRIEEILTSMQGTPVRAQAEMVARFIILTRRTYG